jgi:hypothetical protein
LFLKLLDAKQIRRLDGRSIHGERRNLVVRHNRYQQNKKQEPESELGGEPEPFTQAETA